MLTEVQQRFVLKQRVGHLATADDRGVPHIVPVCFALGERSAYVAIDLKPKRVRPERLKRVRNILENPTAVLLLDECTQAGERVDWLTLHGAARLLTGGDEHAEALRLLRERYPQYRAMPLEGAPIVVLDVGQVSARSDQPQTE